MDERGATCAGFCFTLPPPHPAPSSTPCLCLCLPRTSFPSVSISRTVPACYSTSCTVSPLHLYRTLLCLIIVSLSLQFVFNVPSFLHFRLVIYRCLMLLCFFFPRFRLNLFQYWDSFSYSLCLLFVDFIQLQKLMGGIKVVQTRAIDILTSIDSS